MGVSFVNDFYAWAIHCLDTWRIQGHSASCVHYPSHFIIFLILKFIYLFILAAPGLGCGTRDLSCGMRDLSCGTRAGSSSPTRDRTRAPCIGSLES